MEDIYEDIQRVCDLEKGIVTAENELFRLADSVEMDRVILNKGYGDENFLKRTRSGMIALSRECDVSLRDMDFGKSLEYNIAVTLEDKTTMMGRMFDKVAKMYESMLISFKKLLIKVNVFVSNLESKFERLEKRYGTTGGTEGDTDFDESHAGKLYKYLGAVAYKTNVTDSVLMELAGLTRFDNNPAEMVVSLTESISDIKSVVKNVRKNVERDAPTASSKILSELANMDHIAARNAPTAFRFFREEIDLDTGDYRNNPLFVVTKCVNTTIKGLVIYQTREKGNVKSFFKTITVSEEQVVDNMRLPGFNTIGGMIQAGKKSSKKIKSLGKKSFALVDKVSKRISSLSKQQFKLKDELRI